MWLIGGNQGPELEPSIIGSGLMHRRDEDKGIARQFLAEIHSLIGMARTTGSNGTAIDLLTIRVKDRKGFSRRPIYAEPGTPASHHSGHPKTAREYLHNVRSHGLAYRRGRN